MPLDNNTTAKNNEIKSYRRIVVKSKFGIEDKNIGLILFYSEDDNKGRIVKALGITDVHTDPIQVSTDDVQNVEPSDLTDSETTYVVSPGPNGILETIPAEGDEYSADGLHIVAGTNKQADTTAKFITPQTRVIKDEIIAPLGMSGATNAHLHFAMVGQNWTEI